MSFSESSTNETKITGYLVSTPTIADYLKLKSYICGVYKAKRIWLRQYKPHTSDKELFAEFGIKYSFVSADLSMITVAGNDDFDPLGKLRGKVELVADSIISFNKMMAYVKLLYRMTKQGSEAVDNRGWYNCKFDDDTNRDKALRLLELCGYGIEVKGSTIERSVINVNVITHKVSVGTEHFLDMYREHIVALGKKVAPEELTQSLIRAYELSPELVEKCNAEQPSIKVKPSYIVDMGSWELRKEVARRLEEKGFSWEYVQLLTACHREIFVDFHYKRACIGVRNHIKERTITVEQLYELLDKEGV